MGMETNALWGKWENSKQEVGLVFFKENTSNYPVYKRPEEYLAVSPLSWCAVGFADNCAGIK